MHMYACLLLAFVEGVAHGGDVFVGTGWRRLIGSLIFVGHFFRKKDLYLIELLWQMICNLGDPMSLRHPVEPFLTITTFVILSFFYRMILIAGLTK